MKSNSFDHIYAIYNLLVDKLHQRTMNFQTKVNQQRTATELTVEGGATIESGRSEELHRPKITERSESFNEQLVTHAHSSSTEAVKEKSEDTASVRRESFNENCLRDEGHQKVGSFNEETSSPFVSMPTIPAVYLAGDGEALPLEKVSVSLP